MLPAAMRPWCRPDFFVFFLPLGLATFISCHRMLQELLWEKDLLIIVESIMYRLAIFQIAIGIFIFSSMCCFVYAVLTQNTKLLKHGLVYQETSMFICIAIMVFFLCALHPSLKTDKNSLNNAMSGYGIDDSMTKIMDITQSEFKCCGVFGFTDWMQVNTTFTAPDFSFEFASKAPFRFPVPFTCTSINETSVRFYTRGCLLRIFTFKEHIAYKLIRNVEILLIFEIFFLFLVGCIVDFDTLESNEVILVYWMHGNTEDLVVLDAAANAERRQGEDVPSIYTLYDPPMPLEA